MGKDHLKRMSAPRSWPIKRKENTFITRPHPGGQPQQFGLSLGTLMKEILGLAQTNKQVTFITHQKEVLVDGKKKKDLKTQVGLFDVLSITDVDSHYRVTLDSYGKINAVEIKKTEANLKPAQIKGKTLVKGKTQLNLYDGKNILVDKDEYKVGDTVVIELPSQKIKQTLKLEKGALVFLTGGKHRGHLGTIEDMKGSKLLYKTKEGVEESLKKYAFVVGKDKPVVTVSK